MSGDFFEDHLKLHDVYRDAWQHRDLYFEKLALLDGGTVALVVTAVFGMRGNIGHRVLLVGGVAFLVSALLTLLLRNLAATEIQFHFALRVSHPSTRTAKERNREEWLLGWINSFSRAGVALTIAGMLALGIAACLILSVRAGGAHP